MSTERTEDTRSFRYATRYSDGTVSHHHEWIDINATDVLDAVKRYVDVSCNVYGDGSCWIEYSENEPDTDDIRTVLSVTDVDRFRKAIRDLASALGYSRDSIKVEVIGVGCDCVHVRCQRSAKCI